MVQVRVTPWWVPMAVSHTVLWVCTPLAVLILVGGVVRLVDGIVDMAGWQVLQGLWFTAIGIERDRLVRQGDPPLAGGGGSRPYYGGAPPHTAETRGPIASRVLDGCSRGCSQRR